MGCVGGEAEAVYTEESRGKEKEMQGVLDGVPAIPLYQSFISFHFNSSRNAVKLIHQYNVRMENP